MKAAWGAVGVLLPVFSLFGIVLACLGYGVSYAVEAKFGIPHATVFSSTLELLDLSGIAVLSLAAWLDILLTGAVLGRAWPVYFWVAAVFSACWIVILLAIRYRPWVPTSFVSVRRPTNWFKVPSRHDSMVQSFRSIVWPISASMGLLGFTWMLAFLPAAFALLLTIVPFAGYELGKTYMDHWVIEADVCAPLATAAARIEKAARKPENVPNPASGRTYRIVTCVSLSKDGRPLVTGRVVLANSTSIVIYDPTTGAVQREGLEGISVRVIALGVSGSSTP